MLKVAKHPSKRSVLESGKLTISSSFSSSFSSGTDISHERYILVETMIFIQIDSVVARDVPFH